MTAPRIRIRDVEVFGRPTPFRLPFRFGPVTVDGAVQSFVRLTVEVEGVGQARGASAELMPPKWFDKRPGRTPQETAADLAASLVHAAALANAGAGPDTAFGHHARHHGEQLAWAREQDVTPLSAGFGVAQIDKAVLDGLSRVLGLSFVDVLKANAVGLDARLTADLDQPAIDAQLARLKPASTIAIRHTVGMTDRIEGSDSLRAEIDAADLRWFKVKLSGDPAADLIRLDSIARLLDGRGIDYRLTLDANEQYRPEALASLFALVAADAGLAALVARLLFVEQPFDRAATFEQALDPALAARGVVIDEADDAYDAFPRAKALGYRGVSSKCCKGFYRALLNAARAAAWNAEAGEDGRYFVTAEDLTCQAGLAVQQDTAFVAALGLDHVERNGHHYVDGFGLAPVSEAIAFRDAHPGLYGRTGGRIRLATATGSLDISSLYAPGFASGAEPDWASLQPLTHPTREGLTA
ncbi:enolase [Phreatobacter sp.]|uniref:enolase n=1 Tax=Phreatobacter sp. TaxID=1966341 RepID=UPI003F707519